MLALMSLTICCSRVVNFIILFFLFPLNFHWLYFNMEVILPIRVWIWLITKKFKYTDLKSHVVWYLCQWYNLMELIMSIRFFFKMIWFCSKQYNVHRFEWIVTFMSQWTWFYNKCYRLFQHLVIKFSKRYTLTRSIHNFFLFYWWIFFAIFIVMSLKTSGFETD